MRKALKVGIKGRKKTKGQAAFDDFFNRTPKLKVFKKTSFYSDIRCGILHQGETKGGWKINRLNDNGQVLQGGSKNKKTKRLQGGSIDATKFHGAVEGALNDYAELLKAETEGFDPLERFRKKMKYVCKHCRATKNVQAL